MLRLPGTFVMSRVCGAIFYCCVFVITPMSLLSPLCLYILCSLSSLLSMSLFMLWCWMSQECLWRGRVWVCYFYNFLSLLSSVSIISSLSLLSFLSLLICMSLFILWCWACEERLWWVSVWMYYFYYFLSLSSSLSLLSSGFIIVFIITLPCQCHMSVSILFDNNSFIVFITQDHQLIYKVTALSLQCSRSPLNLCPALSCSLKLVRVPPCSIAAK